MPNNYFVLKNGRECKIVRDGLNPHGVLVPYSEGEIALPIGQNYAEGKRKAMRAITRTLKVAKKWRESVLSDWEKVRHVTEPGIFTIEKREA